ncbi:MAG: hypothetical protein ACRDB1_13110, partial [Microcoleaceae cyanobacterium]
HSDTVTSLAITKNNQTLISGSFDGTIRLWRSPDYQCQKTIQVTRPYEGMNIANARLPPGQSAVLQVLGASPLTNSLHSNN